jgi:hypothetical protein
MVFCFELVESLGETFWRCVNIIFYPEFRAEDDVETLVSKLGRSQIIEHKSFRSKTFRNFFDFF